MFKDNHRAIHPGAIGDAVLVDAKGLANLLLDWADEDKIVITPMKLQKLLFFCHADFLVSYNKKLVTQDFEAWDYGPVIPSVYAEFKDFGANRVTSRAFSFDPISATRSIATCSVSDDDLPKLREIYVFYRRLRAEFLSDLSHVRGGPWRHARSMFANGLNMDRRISDDLIQQLHMLPHD